ncbi:MAG: hypothetical protein QOH22_657 [Gemmatimonadaceae bacterium]|nr:hypothetical protein [Gemmatimonadaceae bacterium]
MLVLRLRGQRRSHQPVPAGMGALELRRCPATDVAQPERDSRRTAHAGVAMDDDSSRIGPGIDKVSDGPRVVLGKKNIRRILLFEDVGEVQSQHRGEVVGQPSRIHIRISNGDADFSLGWLVTLCLLSRKHDKLRNCFFALGHRSITLPPMQRDGQVAHDYLS